MENKLNAHALTSLLMVLEQKILSGYIDI
jgi:hypothetical protein